MSDRDERWVRDEADRYWARWSSTARGRCPATWATAIAADPMLADTRLVADLSLAGGTHRVLLGPRGWDARAGLDGRTRVVQAELIDEPELSESLEPGTPGPQGRRCPLTVAGRLLTPGALVASGWPLAGRGEVSLLAPGVSWDDRLVWIRGVTRGGVRFGTDDEPVDLSIEDPPIGGSEIPPWILDTTRWPDLPDASVGKRVPIVVGRGALECPRVDNADTGTQDEFLVAYGWDLQISAVWVSGTLATLTTDYVVAEVHDGLGLPVTTLQFTSGTGAAADQFAVVHARVAESDARRAGLDLTAAIRRMLHEYSGLAFHRLSDRLFAEASSRAFGPPTANDAAPRLVVNSATGALQFVSDVLDSYPHVSLVWDGAGVGPVVVDHRSTPVASYTRGVYPVLQRPSGARYEEAGLDDLRTQFTLRWNYSVVQDRYNGVKSRNPSTNALCYLAQTLLGVDQADPERESIHIVDEATADYVLDWLCEHRCRPSYLVEVHCYPIAWFTARLGDTVLWTDADMPWADEAPAIVVGRAWSRGLVTLTLRIYPRTRRIGAGALSYQS